MFSLGSADQNLDPAVVSPYLPPQADHTCPPILRRQHTEHDRNLARHKIHGEEGQPAHEVGLSPLRSFPWTDETEIIRIEHGFRTMRNQNDIDTYRQVRRDCEGMGVPVKFYNHPPLPTFGGVAAHASSSSSYYPSSARTCCHLLRQMIFMSSHRSNSARWSNPLSPSNSYNGASRSEGSGWGQAQSIPNAYAQSASRR